MNKTYEKYIDEYKKDIIRDYFYGKNELLNKLYGFEDRGEFTIQVLDELLDLQQENQQLKKQKDDVVEGLKDLKQFVYDELVDFNVIGATETHCKVMNLLRMLGEIDENN